MIEHSFFEILNSPFFAAFSFLLDDAVREKEDLRHVGERELVRVENLLWNESESWADFLDGAGLEMCAGAVLHTPNGGGVSSVCDTDFAFV